MMANSCSSCCASPACSCWPCAARRCGPGRWPLAVAACLAVPGCSTAIGTSRSSVLLGLLAWVPVIVLAGLSVPPLRRAALIAPALPQDQGHPAQGVGHRAGGAQRRHHRLRRRAVLRPARLGEAARRAADHADRGGEGLPRRADQRALPHGQRLGRSATTTRRSPRRSGTSSRSTASSACSSPRSTAASASRRRRSRWCWARSPRARPTCAPSSWCRTRWGRAS